MSEFLTNIFESLPIALVALPMGWLGSCLQSYFSEKGKNLATKEDIKKITRSLEVAKGLSNALIDRKIRAIDEISKELAELKIHCFRQICKQNEHAVPDAELTQKSGFQRAMHLSELSYRNNVFLNEETTQAIDKLTDDVFMMGSMEMHAEMDENGEAKKPDMVDFKLYEKIFSLTDNINKNLHEFLYHND